MYSFEETHISRADRIKRTEEEIFQIVNDFIKKFGHSPSIQEIAKRASVSSKSTVFHYLRRLKEKGLVTWEPKQARSIKIIKTASK